jgi:hypothetical protein
MDFAAGRARSLFRALPARVSRVSFDALQAGTTKDRPVILIGRPFAL